MASSIENIISFIVFCLIVLLATYWGSFVSLLYIVSHILILVGSIKFWLTYIRNIKKESGIRSIKYGLAAIGCGALSDYTRLLFKQQYAEEAILPLLKDCVQSPYLACLLIVASFTIIFHYFSEQTKIDTRVQQ